MSRRGAAAGMNRRSGGGAGGGGSGGGGSLTIPELLASFGAAWTAWWTVYDPTLPPSPGLALSNPGAGDVVDSWTDQRNGFVVPAPAALNRPPYMVDGTHFGGRSVIQCATAGTLHLRGALGGVLFQSTDRPFTAIVFRSLNVTSFGRFVELDDSTPSGQFKSSFGVTNGGSGAPANQYYFQGPPGNPGGVRQDVGTPDTNVHVATFWNDATNGSHLKIDGVEVTLPNANTGTLGTNVEYVAFGASVLGSALSNVNLAEVIEMSFYPGPSIESQLIALQRAKWGF